MMFKLFAVFLMIVAVFSPGFASAQGDLTNEQIHRAIGRKINDNWLIPWGTDISKLDVTLRIKLNPTGELMDVTVLNSSGKKSLDGSLIRAVRNAMPLPIPSDKIMEFTNFDMVLKR